MEYKGLTMDIFDFIFGNDDYKRKERKKVMDKERAFMYDMGWDEPEKSFVNRNKKYHKDKYWGF